VDHFAAESVVGCHRNPQGYLGKGFSDETADFGAGLAVSYRF
jgi:hypothetical protein